MSILITGILVVIGMVATSLWQNEVSETKTVCGWFVSLWDWATYFALQNLIISFLLAIFGFLLFFFAKAGTSFEPEWFSHPSCRWLAKLIHKIKSGRKQDENQEWKTGEWGKKIIIAAVLIFVLNILPLLNHARILQTVFICIGWLVITTLFITIKIPNSWPPFLASFTGLIFLTYYLDFFIFGWDKPWISGILASLIFLLYTIKLFRYIWKKTATKIYRFKFKKELTKKGLYCALISYMINHMNGKKRAETQMSLEVCNNLKTIKLSDQEKINLSKKIIYFQSDKRAEKILKVISEVFRDDNSETILLLGGHKRIGTDLPILFKFHSDKRAVIEKFISSPVAFKFFNETKKEFALSEFKGLMNALLFSYKKEWEDENFLKLLINRMEGLLAMATIASGLIGEINEAEEVTRYLAATRKNYEENGIQVKFPG